MTKLLKLLNWITPSLLLLSLLLLAYWPALSSHYVYHDDVNFFLQTPTQPTPKTYHLSLVIGRFVGAPIYAGYGKLVQYVEDLNIVRVIGFIQLVLSAFIVSHLLKNTFNSRFVRSLICAGLFTLPPFLIITAEAGMTFQISGILFASVASLLISKIPESTALWKKCVHYKTILGIVLFYCAIATHPSTSMFYFSCIFFIVLGFKNDSFIQLFKRALPLYTIGIISMIIYAVSLKIYFKIFAHRVSLSSYNPYEMSFDPIDKLSWFFQEPLVNALNFWSIFPNKSAAYICLAVTMATLLLYTFKFRKISKHAFVLCHFVALIFLSFLPNLLTQDTAPFYRCYAALMPIIYVSILYCLKLLLDLIKIPHTKTISLILLVIISTTTIFLGRNTLYLYRVKPSRIEYSFLHDTLKNKNLNRYKRIHFVRMPRKLIKNRYDEYGGPTASFQGDTLGFFACALKEISRDVLNIHHIHYDFKKQVATFIFKDSNDQTKVHRTILSVGLPSALKPFKEPTLIVDFPSIYSKEYGLDYLLK